MSTISINDRDPNNSKLLIVVIALVFIGLIGISKCKGQEYRLNFEDIKNSKESVSITAGACASPDGTIKQVLYTPSSYQQLLDSGYCYPIGPTKNFTVCYTFTAPSPSVTLNAGYSSSGCVTTTFSGFQLYNCFPSCSLVGIGTNFTTLTPGNCYTWCIVGKCTGIFATGFDHFCPYFQDLNPGLPITLLEFKAEPFMAYNQLEWITATEINCKGYILETSKDALKWLEMAYIECSNTNIHKYSYKDTQFNKGLVYYRLKQIDFNGSINTFKIIFSVSKFNKVIIRILNELNQEINGDYQGIKFIFYEDGSMVKIK